MHDLRTQVLLYTTPIAYLDDILISCKLEGTAAQLNVFVSALGSSPPTPVRAPRPTRTLPVPSPTPPSPCPHPSRR